MRVQLIPLLRDNCAYLIADTAARQAAVIDPSEAAPVAAVLDAEGLELTQIWCTHHHWDHVGGVQELVERYQPQAVLGSAYDYRHQRIPEQTVAVQPGQAVNFFGDVTGTAMEVPGHTLGALAFIIDDALFTGDTLFLGGCGRMYEGNPEQMWKSLSSLRALDPELQVFCGHEYTVKNLSFAAELEPENTAVRHALAQARELRERGDWTVPKTLAEEKKVNPFLRCDDPQMAKAASRLAGHAVAEPSEVFAVLRQAKDKY